MQKTQFSRGIFWRSLVERKTKETFCFAKLKSRKRAFAASFIIATEWFGGYLRLLPTFRGQKNRFFFYLTKFKFVILSSVSNGKTLKISKSGRVI